VSLRCAGCAYGPQRPRWRPPRPRSPRATQSDEPSRCSPPRRGTARAANRFSTRHDARERMTAAYELLDAGDGRRLERFGDVVVDRPAADAEEAPLDPSAWDRADLRYERDHGW